MITKRLIRISKREPFSFCIAGVYIVIGVIAFVWTAGILSFALPVVFFLLSWRWIEYGVDHREERQALERQMREQEALEWYQSEH